MTQQKRVLVFVGLIADPSQSLHGQDSQGECSSDLVELFTKLAGLADQDLQSAYFQSAGEFLVKVDQLQARWVEPSTQTIDISFKENQQGYHPRPETANFKSDYYSNFRALESQDRELNEIPFQGTFGKESILCSAAPRDLILEQNYFPRDAPHEFSIQHVELAPRRPVNMQRTPRFSARTDNTINYEFANQTNSQSFVEANRTSYDSSTAISEAPEVLIKIRHTSKPNRSHNVSSMLEKVLSRRQAVAKREPLTKSNTQKMYQPKQVLSPGCKCHRSSGSHITLTSPSRKTIITQPAPTSSINILLSKHKIPEAPKVRARPQTRSQKGSILLHQSSHTTLQTREEVTLLRSLKDKLIEIKSGRDRSTRETSKDRMSGRMSPREIFSTTTSFLTKPSK